MAQSISCYTTLPAPAPFPVFVVFLQQCDHRPEVVTVLALWAWEQTGAVSGSRQRLRTAWRVVQGSACSIIVVEYCRFGSHGTWDEPTFNLRGVLEHRIE